MGDENISSVDFESLIDLFLCIWFFFLETGNDRKASLIKEDLIVCFKIYTIDSLTLHREAND